jgi:type IV pilus biogenesis protein CpaD/CtpE
MKHIAVIAVLLLSACTADGPKRYHVMAEHPFQIREDLREFDLTGKGTSEVERLALHAGATRPNNGSSFTVAADLMTGEVVRRRLLEAGVAPSDILLIAPSERARILRVDRTASVANCVATPEPFFNPVKIDDGLGLENSNSALFGCAVRRNIAAMTDDPRTLFNVSGFTGRDGARGAEVYSRYVKGQATESAGGPQVQSTSSLSTATSSSGAPR